MVMKIRQTMYRSLFFFYFYLLIFFVLIQYDPTKDACDISDEESLASASDTGGTPLSSQPKSLSKTRIIFSKNHTQMQHLVVLSDL